MELYIHPIIKADDMAYAILQVPDLDQQEKFLIDFGMTRVARTEDTLYMRGDGPQAFIHVSKLGEKKLQGNAFYACSMEDLEELAKTESFSEVEEMTSPGGGFRTFATDPDGIGVQVVYGIENRELESDLAAAEVNVGGVERENFRRFNQPKRFTKGAYPRIKRYAHCGLNVMDLEASLAWYHQHLGIIVSERLKPGGEGGPLIGIFSRCDRGGKPADHHSLFFLPAEVQSKGHPGLNHVSYEMVDIDDVFMGHEILDKQGYELEWGIGRHYQGSQIFDYWRSPFGHIHEHQTDGDVFDNTFLPQVADVMLDGDPNNPEMGPSQWGPPINMETFGDERGL
jgi:catechol 2,3-dioxygenase-like lactoylglutathione lyase family enzyme